MKDDKNKIRTDVIILEIIAVAMLLAALGIIHPDRMIMGIIGFAAAAYCAYQAYKTWKEKKEKENKLNEDFEKSDKELDKKTEAGNMDSVDNNDVAQ